MTNDPSSRRNALQKTETPKIVCFGDSITNGGWPALFQEHLNRLKDGRWEVIAKGVNGNTSAHGFDRLNTDVIPYMPAILIVEFGINDGNHRPWANVPRAGLAEYEKNLREFHRIATTHGGSCIYIVNHPLMPLQGKFAVQGNGKTYQENLDPYNETVRTIASGLNAPIIDLPTLLIEKNIDLSEFLDVDGVHLSAYGDRIYADLVFQAFIRIMRSDGD